jgi:hypothetical protein
MKSFASELPRKIAMGDHKHSFQIFMEDDEVIF